MSTEQKKERVLKIRDLSISFKTDNGLVDAIRGIRLDLFKGETLAIVGESGSGKSVTTKAIMGILSDNGVINEGSIEFTYDKENNGHMVVEDIVKLSKKEMGKNICGRRIAMVFQDPMTSLNPTMTIGKQVSEAMIYHHHLSKQEAYAKALNLLKEVGITDAEKRMKNYPHQLSGGMRQRIVIAIALSCEPEVLICDEPTTALDVTIQAKILELIKKIQRERNLSVIYITHDLGVVAKVADYVAVMYAGKIVEKGHIDEIFYDPRHPYTWGLLSAMPDLDTDDDDLYTIPGTPPNLVRKVKGDAFAPRNRYALNIDYRIEPPLFNVGGSHRVASWLCHEAAPKVKMPESLQKRLAKMRKEAGFNE
ncbi:MAG: ABC transporter ATP-binding protein [Erysipelotrichia bacterium]|nr:ABC transporter ATP-binding protein [Erysipelotrichia bacterium]NCC54770.1 ABC transporter ATP-binding protein [Erysipelotrichia bacterium]